MVHRIPPHCDPQEPRSLLPGSQIDRAVCPRTCDDGAALQHGRPRPPIPAEDPRSKQHAGQVPSSPATCSRNAIFLGHRSLMNSSAAPSRSVSATSGQPLPPSTPANSLWNCPTSRSVPARPSTNRPGSRLTKPFSCATIPSWRLRLAELPGALARSWMMATPGGKGVHHGRRDSHSGCSQRAPVERHRRLAVPRPPVPRM